MSTSESCVAIHMAASLDGFIARKDGRVDWLETPDEFAAGETMEPGFVDAFLRTIDCYVMGSRTYETALRGDESQSERHGGAALRDTKTSRRIAADLTSYRSDDAEDDTPDHG